MNLNIVGRFRVVLFIFGIFALSSFIFIFQDEKSAFVKAGEIQQHLKSGSSKSAGFKSKLTDSEVIGRDGHFIKYSTGVVKDTKTNLEWVVGPDKSTIWKEARQWVQRLIIDGGGWRMPTLDELETLYRKGAGTRNMTPLLETTGFWIWSGKLKGSWGAWGFAFSYGGRDWLPRHYANYSRSFAVRFCNNK